MAINIPKKALIGLAVVLALAVGLALGIWLASSKKNKLPEGIASGNGRLEATLVDVSAKEALRVREIRVQEGAVVKPGEVLVQLDTATLQSELATAQKTVAVAEERLAVAKAAIARQRSELELAEIELARSSRLIKDKAGSQRDLDERRAKRQTAQASLTEAEATLQTAEGQVKVARSDAETVQTRINDATLKSPVVGRVLHRLAEPGEVLPAGGKALTLVNLGDVYMEIFLPSDQAASAAIGAEGRITLDYAPHRVIPGTVSFVSPEAQFTPKQVETRSEREKLMFRVKVQVPQELALKYIEQIKTGVRGVGYVKLYPAAVWPPWLGEMLAP